MTKQDPERRLQLSPAQVAGSALAAMSGAAIISWAGTAGTLIGAAVGSVVATVGAATYTWSLQRTRDAVKRTAAQVRTTALASNALPRRVSAGPLREGESDSDDNGEDEVPERRRALDLPWAKVALASLAVMVIGMAGVTVVEAITGRPFASLLGGDNGTGTTVGHVIGSDKSSNQDQTPKKQTPVTPTPEPSQAPSQEPQQPVPSTTLTPTPTTTPGSTVPPVGSQAPAPDNTLP